MKRLTQTEILKRFRKVHGDTYDYSKVLFKNVDEEVRIICKEHGEFWQTPYRHINRKHGCPYCSRNVKFTREKFAEESQKTHAVKYDYSKVNYINAQEPVEIICPKHGSFWQKANNHRRGGNCPKCVGGVKYNTKDFIERAKNIHKDSYDYSKVNYINAQEPVEIICPKHGSFFVKPANHLQSFYGGCPKCKESNGERIIRLWLEKNGYVKNKDFFQEYKFDECKDIKPLSFDFYIPTEKLLVEFQGKQHYESYEMFGGDSAFTKQKEHDRIKRNFCKDNNFVLLEIPFYEKNIYNILEENIGANKNQVYKKDRGF